MKIRKIGQAGKLKFANGWIYGINPVFEALRSGRTIKELYISSGRRQIPKWLIKEAENRDIPIKTAAQDFFDRNFGKSNQGVAAKVLARDYMPLNELIRNPFIKGETPLFVLLDCVEDPRNFGAILRTADAAGVHGVVIQSYRSVSLSADMSKVSAGAVEYVPVSIVPNIKNAIIEMKKNDILIIGAENNTEKSIWDIKLNIPLALVLGSEGKGLRQTVKEMCDELVEIPMCGKVNSLNVSVAAGIILFEILRQRSINS
ncbi:MAG: 23S rRNA (guanosine(2251)-2'-O)-methyltransferase RlmB [Nitrospirae bacterium]|nr:23S rRNA (guanosine(2251)-2'-O)-methyltransferase RlmB [Nitrospirota bacterium]